MISSIWFWIILVAICTTIYILLIKYITISHNWIFFVVVLALFLVEIFGYYKAFSMSQVSSSFTLMKVLTIILVAIGGVILFQEHLSFINILGIIVIVIGALLLIYNAPINAKTSPYIQSN